MVGLIGAHARTRTLAIACLATTILAGAALAHAKSNYDGNWSVLIVTDKGPCDRAYRYPVRIANGTVGYGGQANFTVTGRVQGNGAIQVTVRRGSQSASGTGRLTASGGSGSWRGGECAGSWSAEKRA